MRASLALALTLAGAACAGPAHQPTELDGRQELLALEGQFMESVASKQSDRFAEFLAEDAVFLPVDGGMAVGRDAVVEAWQPLLDDPDLRLDWMPIQAEVSGDRTLGYTFGTWRQARRGDTGFKLVRTGRYLTVWRRSPSGTWIVAVDIGNADPEPHPDLTF